MPTRSFKSKLVIALAVLALGLLATVPALAYDSQLDRQARVFVQVQPTTLQPGQPAAFTVSLNTHSVELGQDLAKVSTLTDDLGTKYAPSAWKGSPPGGHHRSGTLLFPALDTKAAKVTLLISGVGGVNRSFSWSIEK